MLGGAALLLWSAAYCAASETPISLNLLPPFQLSSVQFPDLNRTHFAEACRNQSDIVNNYTFMQEHDDWFEINVHIQTDGQLNQRHAIRILEANETGILTNLTDITTIANHSASSVIDVQLLSQARCLIVSYSVRDRCLATSQNASDAIFRGRVDIKRDMSDTITVNCSADQVTTSVPSFQSVGRTGYRFYLWGDENSVKCRELLKRARTLLLAGKEPVSGASGQQTTVMARCSRGVMAVTQEEFLVPFVAFLAGTNLQCNRLFTEFIADISKDF